MLPSFNHSCYFIKKNGFAGFSWKFPNYNMFCKMSISMELAFSPPPLIVLLTGPFGVWGVTGNVEVEEVERK